MSEPRLIIILSQPSMLPWLATSSEQCTYNWYSIQFLYITSGQLYNLTWRHLPLLDIDSHFIIHNMLNIAYWLMSLCPMWTLILQEISTLILTTMNSRSVNLIHIRKRVKTMPIFGPEGPIQKTVAHISDCWGIKRICSWIEGDLKLVCNNWGVYSLTGPGWYGCKL